MKETGQCSLLALFLTFFKIGAFSFGGGYAMMPVIEREVVDKRKWVKKEEIADIFAVTGCLPGAIGLNASAFIGYMVKGVKGTVVAVCGNLMPSVIIILLLSMALEKVRGNHMVEAAFLGIRPVVISLIAFAAYRTAKTSLGDLPACIMCLVALIACIQFSASTIPIIFAGGIFGLAIQTVMRCMGNFKKERG